MFITLFIQGVLLNQNPMLLFQSIDIAVTYVTKRHYYNVGVRQRLLNDDWLMVTKCSFSVHPFNMYCTTSVNHTWKNMLVTFNSNTRWPKHSSCHNSQYLNYFEIHNIYLMLMMLGFWGFFRHLSFNSIFLLKACNVVKNPVTLILVWNSYIFHVLLQNGRKLKQKQKKQDTKINWSVVTKPCFRSVENPWNDCLDTFRPAVSSASVVSPSHSARMLGGKGTFRVIGSNLLVSCRNVVKD